MLAVKIEKIGDVAIVAFEGKVSEAAFQLREAVSHQTGARTVVVELSGGSGIDREDMGLLVSLQRWARNRGIQFKVFSPLLSVREMLRKATSMSEFDVPALHELISQLVPVGRSETLAVQR
jgi:anti-anti-sigma regulatory factor